MTTAPAGPLAGATRQRPDGWLANPLTTDPQLAEKQARVLLAEHHDEAEPGPVRCLTARYRSAVFTLGDPADRIFKRHADEAAYFGEALAYDLLAADPVLPVLREDCDASRTLIVDYLPEPANLRDRDVFAELVGLVAVVHTAPARWDPDVGAAMAAWEIGTVLAEPVPGWIAEPVAWRLLLRLTADAHGLAHVPLGHLDLKADHARRHHDGGLALVDAETLRPDLTGLPDLITLAALARELKLNITGPDIRACYRRRVNELGARWTDPELVAALRAFATATGLRSLHGVTG